MAPKLIKCPNSNGQYIDKKTISHITTNPGHSWMTQQYTVHLNNGNSVSGETIKNGTYWNKFIKKL